MTSNSSAFVLKGSLFTMTVLQLHSTDLRAFATQLTNTVKQSPKFFQNAPLIIDLQGIEQSTQPLDFDVVQDLLRSHEIIPVGVRGGSDAQQRAALQTGLALFPVEKTSSSNTQQTQATTEMSTRTASPSVAPVKERAYKLVTQTVRSGQQIYAPEGDLIVTASVGHGAELLAQGNIHVYGTLRGRALAGVHGDQQARIFCQQMQAQLISIAGVYLVNERETEKVISSSGTMTQIYLEAGRLMMTEVC